MIRVFNHYLHRQTVRQVSLDLLLVVLVVASTTLWQGANLVSTLPFVIYAVLLGIGVLLINMALGFYQRVHDRSVIQSRARGVLALLLVVPLIYGIFQVPFTNAANRRLLAICTLIGVALVVAHRIYKAHAKPQGALRHRVLVFGTGQRAAMVGKTLKKDDPNVDVVGYYSGVNEPQAEVSAWGILSPHKSLTETALELEVDEIVVALTERRGGSMPLSELLDCKLRGVRVVDIATHFEKTKGQIRLDSVSPGWLIFGDGFEQGVLRTVVKRLFDIICALILLVLASPVMLLAGLIVLLESGAPVFYRQQRVGYNGTLFDVVKFRSMRTDAEKDGKPRWATSSDDRVTRFGRIMRKLRIDELPQLLCVLNGDMSLVGPRPERPYFVEQLTQKIPYYSVRESVKPGVTGWAQVRYHYGASAEDAAEKLQYDLYYVKNHSLFLDLVILFDTVGVVLLAKGAQ